MRQPLPFALVAPHTGSVIEEPTPTDASGGRLRTDPEDSTVLRVEGEVDIDVVYTFADELGIEGPQDLGKVLAAGGVRAVDLSDATFIDSSAIALLVSITSHLRPERLSVRGATGGPLMALQATGLDQLFEMEPAQHTR